MRQATIAISEQQVQELRRNTTTPFTEDQVTQQYESLEEIRSQSGTFLSKLHKAVMSNPDLLRSKKIIDKKETFPVGDRGYIQYDLSITVKNLK